MGLFWGPFWTTTGPKRGPKRKLKMEPILEPLAPHLRSRHVGRSSLLRGCRKGAGWLEIYPAKEREGYSLNQLRNVLEACKQLWNHLGDQLAIWKLFSVIETLVEEILRYLEVILGCCIPSWSYLGSRAELPEAFRAMLKAKRLPRVPVAMLHPKEQLHSLHRHCGSCRPHCSRVAGPGFSTWPLGARASWSGQHLSELSARDAKWIRAARSPASGVVSLWNALRVMESRVHEHPG